MTVLGYATSRDLVEMTDSTRDETRVTERVASVGKTAFRSLLHALEERCRLVRLEESRRCRSQLMSRCNFLLEGGLSRTGKVSVLNKKG
jgi:hypothetical protein